MYFPLFVDLTDRRILVVGAGRVASRRVGTLCSFAGRITVVAPEVSAEMAALAGKYSFSVLSRAFSDRDLDGAELVLAATNDRELNRRIGRLCRQRGILVNVCSDPSLCDFQFPSVLRREEVVIGVNASGSDHRLVKETRRELETILQGRGFRGCYRD